MKKLLICAVVSASLMMVGCQTTKTNAYTGEEEVNSTTKGALGGCATGAIVGALLGKGKGAAIGCLTGGTAGGIYGAQLDKQEELLRAELVGTGVQLKRQNDSIRLVMNGDITFASGNANLSSRIKPALRSVAKVMKEYDETGLVVRGHTDSVGDAAFNQSLSLNRARNVATYIKAYGVNSGRVASEGMGESAPRCENDTAQGRSCNRRVELILYPQG